MFTRFAYLARPAWSLMLGILAFGCTVSVPIGRHDAGPRVDQGGPDKVVCGPVTCERGQICCNDSCGYCVEPGGACTEELCSQGCTSNDECGVDEYCASATCGDPGVCVPRPEACTREYDPVCGCDGVTYGNGCTAYSAGVNVASEGECSGGQTCDPMDAVGVGDCDAAFGIAWNGEACFTVSGCECQGTQCDETFESFADCEAAYAACLDPGCLPQDARGVGPCEAELGTLWNGSACITISGCSCEGSDCEDLFADPEQCEAAYASCVGCTSDDDCGSDEHCYYPDGSCGVGGSCSPVPPGLPCGPDDEAVCGCDGVTYECRSAATSAGASVSTAGTCGGLGCAAQDIEIVGECDLPLGIWWDGISCEDISGCECIGSDCSNSFATLAACEATYALCDQPPGGACGGVDGRQCRPDEWCDWEVNTCGLADTVGECEPRPDTCPGIHAPVIGCDGGSYGNECLANQAGQDISER